MEGAVGIARLVCECLPGVLTTTTTICLRVFETCTGRKGQNLTMDLTMESQYGIYFYSLFGESVRLVCWMACLCRGSTHSLRKSDWL